MLQGLSDAPGPKAYGPFGQSARATLSSLAPRTISPDPVIFCPGEAYHQPCKRSALGGRSPTRSVLLIPSVTLCKRTRASVAKRPSRALRFVPDEPRYEVNA